MTSSQGNSFSLLLRLLKFNTALSNVVLFQKIGTLCFIQVLKYVISGIKFQLKRQQTFSGQWDWYSSGRRTVFQVQLTTGWLIEKKENKINSKEIKIKQWQDVNIGISKIGCLVFSRQEVWFRKFTNNIQLSFMLSENLEFGSLFIVKHVNNY